MSTYAKSIDFLFNQMRSGTAGTLAGGTVYFYDAGATSTPKAVWTNRAKTQPTVGGIYSYVLTADGTAELFGDGLYYIVIKDADDVTVYDYDYVEFTDASALLADVTELQADFAASHNADGSQRGYVDATQYGTLAATIAAVPTTTQIWVTNNQTLTAGTVNHPIHVAPGGLITATSGTVTFANSFTADPLLQCLSGAATFKFSKGAVLEVYPEWFGAKGDWNGSTGTDDTTAIQACVNSFQTIKFARRGYKVTAAIYFDPTTTAAGNGGWHITGSGQSNTAVYGSYLYQATAATPAFKFGKVTATVAVDQQSYIADMAFTGVSTAYGVQLGYAEDFKIERCKFAGIARGLDMASAANTETVKPRIYNCSFGNSDYGIVAVGTRTADVWVQNCQFIDIAILPISLSGSADGGYITDNFFGNSSPAAGSRWIYLQVPVWVNIERNHFYNCGATGVEMTSPRNNTIRGNQFYRASQSDRTKFALLFSSQGTGVQGFNNMVEGNTFWQNYGVALNSTVGSNNDFVINNTFSGTGYLTGSKVYDHVVVTDAENLMLKANNFDGSAIESYITATTTAASTTVTIASYTGTTLATGMAFTGKGIPPNTTITDVSGMSGTSGTIVISNATVMAATSEVFVAGVIYTRYAWALTSCSYSRVEDNIINNHVNTKPFTSGLRAAYHKNNIYPVTYTTTASADLEDEVIYVTSAAPWTLTIPNAVLFVDKEITIVKTDAAANTVTVAASGGGNINGAASYTGLSAQYKYLRVRSNGVQWYITGSN